MIAAMNENRVIGLNDRLPWRIPEDIAWYQSQTDGQLILMGRKTFESIRRRPEGTHYIVLSKTLTQEGLEGQNVTIIRDISELKHLNLKGEGWVCGGAMLYGEMLAQCEEIFLSEVVGTHEGDAYFPAFEEAFESPKVIKAHPEFTIKHYVRKKISPHRGSNRWRRA